MKIKFRWLFLLILPLLVACEKNNFDFSHMNGAEISGNWGVPLINARYSIDDVLQQFDTDGIITVNDNGTLSLVYEIEKEKVIEAKDYLSLNNVYTNVQYNFEAIDEPIAGLSYSYSFVQTISMPSDILEVNSAQVKEGTLSFELEHNITADFSFTISCSQITDNQGNQFYTIINSSNNSTTSFQLDLSNYTISPEENNSLSFSMDVTVISTGEPALVDEYVLRYSIRTENIHLKNMLGRVDAFEIEVNEHADIDIFSNNFGGDLTFFHPKLTVYTKNTFGMTGICRIDTAAFASDNSFSSIISNTPVLIPIPISPNSYHDYTLTQIEAVNLSTQYNQIMIAGSMTINPDGFDAGVVYIDENSYVNYKIITEIPFNINIENAYYTDTLDFELPNVDDNLYDLIEDLQFRFLFTNGLPVNVFAQVLFMDTLNQIQDSLLLNPQLLHACYQDNPTPSMPVYVDIPRNKIAHIARSKKLAVRFRLDTGTHEVIFKSSQILQFEANAKFSYNGSLIIL